MGTSSEGNLERRRLILNRRSENHSVCAEQKMTEGSAASWREKLFKVLVIGDLSVGKTSVILRYVNKRFVEKYKASIGVDFALKTIEWDPQTVVRLQFWDIAGECGHKRASSNRN